MVEDLKVTAHHLKRRFENKYTLIVFWYDGLYIKKDLWIKKIDKLYKKTLGVLTQRIIMTVASEKLLSLRCLASIVGWSD